MFMRNSWFFFQVQGYCLMDSPPKLQGANLGLHAALGSLQGAG